MKFTVWSDLHAEINQFIEGLTAADGGDVLILAGDIFNAGQLRYGGVSQGTLRLAEALSQEVFPRFKKVVYVLGNHEHFNANISQSASLLGEWLASLGTRNLSILDDEWITVNDVVIYGCTLWTDLSNEVERSTVESGRDDYRLIRLHDREEVRNLPAGRRITGTITGAYTHGLHTRSLSKLKVFLEQKSVDPFLALKSLVIVSHHPPSKKSINTRHSANGLDSAYASDLDELVHAHPEIKVWVHGHTHMNFDYQIGKTRIFANQYGYCYEEQKNNFDVNGGFEA